MKWFTRSRQRCLGLLAVVTLLLSLALAACGSPANAAHSSAPASNSTHTQSQQYQPSNSDTTTQNTGNKSVQNTDQQIQSLLQQLDGAQKDASNADAGASQDGGQP